MKVVHWKKSKPDDPNIVYIGRPSLFGNPFSMDNEAQRDNAITMYRNWFIKRIEHDGWFRERVFLLRGHDLACWCAPKPCHGDVIIEWLEKYKETIDE